MFTITEFQRRYSSIRDVINNINELLSAAQNGKLMSRHRKLISENANNFVYWLQNNQRFHTYIPGSSKNESKFIILHALLALKLKLPRDANNISLYCGQADNHLQITAMNRNYYKNPYHVLLEYTYRKYYTCKTADADSKLYYRMLFYYNIYILEQSIIDVYITDAIDNQENLPDWLFLLADWENIANNHANLSLLTDMNMLNLMTDMDVLNLTEFNNLLFDQTSQVKKNLLLQQTFHNYASYNLYMYSMYGHKLTQPFLNCHICNSDLAAINYILSLNYNLRRRPVPRSFKLVKNNHIYAMPSLLQLAQQGKINSFKPRRLVLLMHIAKYGLNLDCANMLSAHDVKINPIDIALTIFTYTLTLEKLRHAILIKMGISSRIAVFLDRDTALAIILSGVLPDMPELNTYYGLNVKNSCYINIFNGYYSILQQKFLQYYYMLKRKLINKTQLLANIASTKYIVQHDSYPSSTIRLSAYSKLEIIQEYTSWLSALPNNKLSHYLMNLPVRSFIYLEKFFDRRLLFNLLMYYHVEKSIFNTLPYIDFTLNNQQLCDKYNIANIYSRSYLLCLLALVLNYNNSTGVHIANEKSQQKEDIEQISTKINEPDTNSQQCGNIYYRKPAYELGDGRLYELKTGQTVKISLEESDKIISLLKPTSSNFSHIISLIYALNLFEVANMEQINQLNLPFMLVIQT